MVDGHLRASLAISEGQKSIPVTYVDLSPEEETLILATIDPLSAMAAADKEKLDTLLREVETGDAAVMGMLSELAARSGVIPPNDPNAEWKGMPEFEQEDLTAFKALTVNFASLDHMQAFAKLVGQTITEKTRSIWYPRAEIGRYADKVYQDES